MWRILEIVIIILAGLVSAAFLARYFFISSRAKKQAGFNGCGSSCNGGCSVERKEFFTKILNGSKNNQIKKAAGKGHPPNCDQCDIRHDDRL
jgi:hypothetical protein